MIFYFTGTGNSYEVAKILAEEDEAVININDAMRENHYVYSLKEGERLGFSFPVYAYTINDIVLQFIHRLVVMNVTYTYAIITCGASIGDLPGYLKTELGKRHIKLNYAKKVVMGDNAVFFYDIDSDEKLEEVHEKSFDSLLKIKKDIQEEKESKIYGGMISKLCRPVYHTSTSTKKFYVEESCISCGKCARNCPTQAITLIDGKPVWIKSNCTKCTACINRCPVHAIQYGKKTAHRNRYENPILR